MGTRMERLLQSRNRIIANLRNHCNIIGTFTPTTNPRLIGFREGVLDRSYEEFQTNIRSTENALGKDEEITMELIKQIHDVENVYLDAKVVLSELRPSGDEAEQSRLNSTQQIKIEPNFKLPPIQMPPFSGKFEDWMGFRELFDSLIQSNNQIPDSHKFYYLKANLTSEPLKLVQHLHGSDEDYIIAWELLKDNYENKRAILNAHLKALFNLPSILVDSVGVIRQVINTINESLAAIRTLGVDTASWDSIIIYLINSKMDFETRRYWEEHMKGSRSIPELTELLTFLKTRFTILDALKNDKKQVPIRKPHNTSKILLTQERSSNVTCPICALNHRPYRCVSFAQLGIADRVKIVKEKQLCENCLFSHKNEPCRSKFTCRYCSGAHSSLLHTDQTLMNCANISEETTVKEEKSESESESEDDQSIIEEKFIGNTTFTSSILLATAVIPVLGDRGQTVHLNALIDQGSMTNLITKSAADLLTNRMESVKIPLTGVGNSQTGIIEAKMKCTIGSLYDTEFRCEIEALVLPRITKLPATKTPKNQSWNHLEGLNLADPTFTEAKEIDILIGASTFTEILLNGVICGRKNMPMAQKTRLGWIVSGKTSGNDNMNKVQCNLACVISNEELSERLRKFWEIEESETETPMNPEAIKCAQWYTDNTHRTVEGRFCTKFPFKISPKHENFLGQSYPMALSRYIQLKRKLNKNPEIKKLYEQGMNEYRQLRYLKILPSIDETNAYFMPHHGVYKESSSTTKLRIVFDASAKTSNGMSLNDRLLVGPTIQDDLFTLATRFRKFIIPCTADITKMYNQIQIAEEDQKFQSFLWEFDDYDGIQQCVFDRLGFGTGCAPYIAIRSLTEIADNLTKPLIAYLLKKCFYVDDFLGGA